MDDKHPEALAVTLGGKGRVLKLTSGALRVASLKHGVEFTGAQIASLGFHFVARLMWVAMLPDDPDMTEAEAATLYAQVSDADEDRISRYVLGRFSSVSRRLNAIVDEEGRKGKAEAAETATTPTDPGPIS